MQILKYEQIDKEVTLTGITRQDIQDIFSKAFLEQGIEGNLLLLFDVSYLMNFHVSDFNRWIKKMTWATRYDIGLMKDWHRLCERWYLDQTVRDGRGEWVKPIDILRKADKVPNEGMEMLAACLVGQDSANFIFGEIGKGVGVATAASDGCIDPVDRINIIEDSIGGSVNRDGSTVYWVHNHDVDVEEADVTESAILDHEDSAKDHCANHTVFDGYFIDHQQGVDAVSRTTALFMCSV